MSAKTLVRIELEDLAGICGGADFLWYPGGKLDWGTSYGFGRNGYSLTGATSAVPWAAGRFVAAIRG